MDRSTRNLSIITLLVLAIFLGLNHIARGSALGDWWLVLLFLLLALAIWFYDRVSHRGIDDSEMADTPIEPVSYEHHAGTISIPESVQVAGPGESTPPAPPKQAVPVTEGHADAKAEPVEFQSSPMPPRPRPDVDNANRGAEAATETRAASNLSDTPSTDVIAEDKTEVPPPLPAAGQSSATTTVTTSIEEKAAPPPSAPAPETHPELAAKAPDGASLPSVPVTAETAGEPVPTAISGSAPEPVAPRSSTENVPNIPPKDAPQKPARGKGKGKAASATAPAATLPPAQPDDLKVVEGIGPKMEKALNAAGISTFAQLAASTEEQINAAIVAAGMRFAPSAPTWAAQASYAAKGDLAGLEAFQKTLLGGRKAK